MSNHFEIFPTAIGKYSYTDHAKLKPIIRNVMDTTNEVRNIKDAKHYFEYTGSFLDNPLLSDFKTFLESSVNDYANNLLKLNTQMFVSLSWINQTNTNCVMGTHNHCNSYFSGTYYLNYNKEIHAPIIFSTEIEHSAKSPYMGITPQEYNNINSTVYNVNDLDEGILLIWPSHLLHGHGPNLGDDRISISMNFLPTQLNNGIYSFKISRWENE
jgi:hypothetical protein